MNKLFILFKKDLKILFSNFYGIFYSLFMGLLIVFLISLVLEKTKGTGIEIASLTFWIASFFALMILFRDLYKTDNQRIREELLIANIEPQLVWLSKCLAGFLIFFLIQLLLLGATVIFLDLSIKSSILRFLSFLFLIDIGLVCLCSLFSAASDNVYTESTLVLILFPLQIPLLLSGTKAYMTLFTKAYDFLPWLKLTISCNAIFIGAGLILFPYIYKP